MFFIFLMVIIVKQQVDKVLLSMTVIYVVSIQFALSDMFMNIGNMHLAMWNYDSVKHLIESPEQEKNPIVPITKFIQAGEIEFENYSSNFGAPLHNLSFKIRMGEKILIAGRSGAGKTSIVHALARVMEPKSGKILIDGVDIQKVNILELWEKITFIPQYPVMLKGSLRFNLDPDNKRTDEEI